MSIEVFKVNEETFWIDWELVIQNIEFKKEKERELIPQYLWATFGLD